MIFEYITVRTSDDLEEALQVIWDFLHEQAKPGMAVTRSAAVRYAILTAAARIKEQQEQQGGK